MKQLLLVCFIGQEDNTFMSCEVASQSSDSFVDLPVAASHAPPIGARISRRRSRSLAGGLDCLQHNFLAKTTLLFDESCGYCKTKISFCRTAYRCSGCRVIVHERCRGFLPVPCIPTTLDPNADKSGGASVSRNFFSLNTTQFHQ